MGYLKKNGGAIVAAVVELLVGVLLFINPDGLTSGILMALGGVLIIFGVIFLIRYFNTEPVQAAMEQNFSKGLIMILLGCVLALFTQQIIDIFSLAPKIYGVVILIIGVMKLQQSVDLLRQKAQFWFLASFNALLAVAFAAIILSNLIESTDTLWWMAAAALIAEAVFDAVVLVMTRKKKAAEK